MRYALVTVVAQVICFLCGNAQLALAEDTPLGADPENYRIDNIVFTTDTVAPDGLESIVQSRATSLLFTDEIIEYYAKNVLAKGSYPRWLEQKMRGHLEDIEAQFQYYVEDRARDDCEELRLYLSELGYHSAQVTHTFHFTGEKAHTLEFILKEGVQTELRALRYIGLDSIDTQTRRALDEVRTVEVGQPYNEIGIVQQSDAFIKILRDRGYYYSSYSKAPPFKRSHYRDDNRDSVTVWISAGPRVRIANIHLVDSTSDQISVATNTRRKMLSFREGEWYNESKVRHSQRELLGLGTFEIVSIDTTSLWKPMTDSTVNLLVYTKSRQNGAFGVAPLVNKNLGEDVWNLGAEAYVSHQNLFAGAQRGRLFIRGTVQDINRLVTSGRTELEGQFGFDFSQPFVTRVFGHRVDQSLQLRYRLNRTSSSFTDEPITFSQLATRLNFTVRLDDKVFINRVSPYFLGTFGTPDIPEDVQIEFTSAYPTRSLANQLFQFGFVFGGDHRNHPFLTTKGNYLNGSLDYGFLTAANADVRNARFARLNVGAAQFTKVNSTDVFGMKFKLGHIWWSTSSVFLPEEVVYQAGGGNSNRAWSYRELRTTPLSDTLEGAAKELHEQLGNGTILEASFEYRWKFIEQTKSEDFWFSQLSRLGITAFTDLGNASNSFDNADVYDNDMIAAIGEVLDNVAVSTGVGLRYDTPVGPFRLDIAWKFYNPLRATGSKFLWQSKDYSPEISVGLGHAF